MPDPIPSLAGATREDAGWLRFAADLALRHGHTARSLLASVEDFQRESGKEFPAALRLAAADIARSDPDAGAGGVARTLLVRAEIIDRRAARGGG